LLLVLLLRN